MESNHEPLLNNVIVVGASLVGKSALVERITKNRYNPGEAPCLFSSVNTTLTTCHEEAVPVCLKDLAWNTTEHDASLNQIKEHCKTANTIIYVVDSTQNLQQQWNTLGAIQETILFNAPPNHVPILVFSKCDNTRHRIINDDGIFNLEKLLLDYPSREEKVQGQRTLYTSAQTGDEIQKLTECIASNVLRKNALDRNVLEEKRASSKRAKEEKEWQAKTQKYLVEFRLKRANEAIKFDSPVFNTPNKDTAERFETYLRQAVKRISQDFNRGALSYKDARGAAEALYALAEKVADNTVTSYETGTFRRNESIQKAKAISSRFSLILGGLIGAALGVALGIAIGAMLGAGTGPGALATALMGGFSGGMKGAAIGMAAGGLGIGGCGSYLGYTLGSKFSIWNHPLKGLEEAAEELAEAKKDSTTGDVPLV